MARESDTLDVDDSPSEATDPGTDEGRFDAGLPSDLFINVVLIAIVAAFVLLLALFAPGGEGSDSLRLHSALLGGIVLVSIVVG